MEQFIDASGGFLWIMAAFVVALSIIVAIHEYGHYIVGRWCGIGAEVFSIGFGPVLFSRVDKRGTKWQFAALPFGGYVKFNGDSNATSVVADGMLTAGDHPPPRDTMLGAPLWARSLTIAAGPVFNFILSIVIFAGIGLYFGQTKSPLTIGALPPLPYEVQELEEGDVILAVGGEETPDAASMNDLASELSSEPVFDYRILRDGEEMVVQGPHPHPARVLFVGPQTAAFDVEVKEGDVITAIDGDPIVAFQDIIDKVTAAEGRPVVLDIWRDGRELQFTLSPRETDSPLPEGGFEKRYLIGISGGAFFEPATERPGVFQAIWGGVLQVWGLITMTFEAIAAIVQGVISTCNLSGPIGIAQVSGAVASQGLDDFILFIAALSTAVGLINLFPIPVLDGGHLVFNAYEAVARKPPSQQALKILMAFGIALLGCLMIFAIFNDLRC
ncbi:RIP metalloprotease RseP [Aestuariibius insulae]|uniref:RIP metalloprotease RseP n=1 Tax=Aestuariibius insulae TaxID=2058287 RepID=UPI003482CA46